MLIIPTKVGIQIRVLNGGNMPRPATLTAAAGEHYVAFQLSARGFVVGTPRAGVPYLDLIVTQPETGNTVSIQVKCTDWAQRKTHFEWHGGAKSMTRAANSQCLALVDLKWGNNKGEPPDVYLLNLDESEHATKFLSDGDKMKLFWLNEEDALELKNNWKRIEDELGGDTY